MRIIPLTENQVKVVASLIERRDNLWTDYKNTEKSLERTITDVSGIENKGYLHLPSASLSSCGRYIVVHEL